MPPGVGYPPNKKPPVNGPTSPEPGGPAVGEAPPIDTGPIPGPVAPVGAGTDMLSGLAGGLDSGTGHEGGGTFPASREELQARFNGLDPIEKDIIATAMTPEVGAVMCKILGAGCEDLVAKQVVRVPGQKNPQGATISAPMPAGPLPGPGPILGEGAPPIPPALPPASGGGSPIPGPLGKVVPRAA